MATVDKIQTLFDKYKIPVLEFEGKCHDCGTGVRVEIEMDRDGKTVVKGGALYLPDDVDYQRGYKYLKCDKCFAKDHTLRNYRTCEVYSRVVGYLRPIKQWNAGKQAEYKIRKTFDMKEMLAQLDATKK